jgi:hypothetical protein
VNSISGTPIYDAAALQRWKSASLPADPDAALKEEAAAATSRAALLRESIKLGGSDEVTAIRNQAQRLKAEFLAEVRTPERVAQLEQKDRQLAFRAALAGMMVGALEGALALAGQQVCAPVEVPTEDNKNAQGIGSKVFSTPSEFVARLRAKLLCHLATRIP